MTNEEAEEIAQRNYKRRYGYWIDFDLSKLLLDDIPALLEERKRLRLVLEQIRSSCQLGNSTAYIEQIVRESLK